MSTSAAALSSPPAARWKWVQPALALMPFLLLLSLAWRGIDFGDHWDENHNKINGIAYSLDHNFTLLPDGYTYPGVNFWLTFLALAPELKATYSSSGSNPEAFKQTLAPVIHGNEFRLRLRRIYAFVTALAAAWIYLAILVWDGRWLQAMAGSLLFATCWEIIYHARWIAPDSVLMQFGALTFLLVGLAWKKNLAWANTLAAMTAGLACGAKYPGALIFIPVLLVPFLQVSRSSGWFGATMQALKLCVVFTVSYLLTTPGTIVQPLAFYDSLVSSKNVYANGWYGYTVVPGWSHLGKILFYFGDALFSAIRPLAWVFIAFAFAGIWATVRQNWRNSLLVLVFPVLYTLYFSRQATMVVRNYLIVTPFLFFLAARGLAWVHGLLPNRLARALLLSGVAALVAVDAADQVRASNSVVRRNDSARFAVDFVNYAKAHPGRRILVSNRLENDLRQRNLWTQPNLFPASSGDPKSFDLYAGYYSEIVMPHELVWQTNRPGSFTAVFGPRDVNLNYYSGWHGSDRIALTSLAQSQASGVAAW